MVECPRCGRILDYYEEYEEYYCPFCDCLVDELGEEVEDEDP